MTRIVLLLAVSLAGVACGRRDQDPPPVASIPAVPATAEPPAPAPAPPPRPPITGIDWVLIALGDKAVTPEAGRAPATLRFETDSSRASGFAGCNRFSGTFNRRGDSLSFGAMMSTKMACAATAGNDAELAYLAMLPYVRSYEVRDSVLTLIGVAGSLAKFVRRTP